MKTGRPALHEPPRAELVKVTFKLDAETLGQLKVLEEEMAPVRGRRSATLRRLIAAAFFKSTRK